MKNTPLRELMGMKTELKFSSSEEYKNHLESLNKAKLQKLCMERGLMASHDRRAMLKTLEKEFNRDLAKSVKVEDRRKISNLSSIRDVGK